MSSIAANAFTLIKHPEMWGSYGRWVSSRRPSLTLPWGDKLSGFRNYSEYRSGILGIPTDGEIALVQSALRNGGAALDVGANLGTMALLMAHSGASTVHAFEPAPGTAEIFAANARQYPNICVHRAAVTSETGTAFFLNESGGSATNRLASPHEANSVKVQTDTIDAFCFRQNIDRIAFLKIDVEGFEPKVLQGAKRMLSEGRVASGMIEIIPELLERTGYAKDVTQLILSEFGYAVAEIKGSIQNFVFSPV